MPDRVVYNPETKQVIYCGFGNERIETSLPIYQGTLEEFNQAHPGYENLHV